MMEKEQRKQLVIQMLTAGIITFCLLWLLFYIKKYVPFGVHSLASKDADFQYLDFLAYLKDVFDGKNNIDYSFSKSIGGACIGVFSYYLSSPFNLLLLLFDKSQLVLFVHVIITLKLACAAATFVFYLNMRFEEWNDGSVKKQALIIFLAVSYAVSQYGIAQACNIMWLDGFYMLPLIMLGVYRVVNGGRPVMLSVSVALAVLFNWYMGGINCVFACFWFLFEFAYSRLYSGDTKAEKTVIKDFAGKLGRFIYSMLAGVLISGVLFLPTIGAMRYSVRGSLDLGSLLDMSFIGDVSSVIDGYSLGAQSQKGSVSLYCGCLALIGFIGIFIGKKHNVKQKILAFVTLVVMLLMFYWNPLCMAFSLFKEVGSYWYRYSHVGIFCILFFAAEFFLSEDLNAVKWRVIIASAIFSAAMLGVNYLHGVQDNKLVWLTDALIVGVAVLIALISRLSKNVGAGRVFGIIFTVILCAVLTVETGYSVMLQMDNIHIDNGESFVEYETAMEGLINDLKEYDSDTYRISQTRSRATRSLEKKKNNNGKDTDDNFKYKNNVRANYDELFGYGYWAIGSYVSTADSTVLNFLVDTGYRSEGDNLSVVNMPVLGTDSLLGVRYIVSDYALEGMDKVEDIADNANGAGVYENPYSLPMAFVYDSGKYTAAKYNGNPFEYQNELYSELLGRKVEIYKPLKYETVVSKAKKRVYKMEIPEGNYIAYGNIPWNSLFNAKLNVNGIYRTGYARWLSPSVFNIPVNEDRDYYKVVLHSKQKLDLDDGAEQFYVLDLDLLKSIAEELEKNTPDVMDIENGSAEFVVNAKEGQSLFTSIPYCDGWTVKVNGQKVQPDKVVDSLYSISLVEGENVVEMKFHVKYAGAGIACSIIGIAMLVFAEFYRKRRK